MHSFLANQKHVIFFIHFNILEILLIIFKNGNLWGNTDLLPPLSFLFLSLTPFVQTSPAVGIKKGSHSLAKIPPAILARDI